MVLISLKLIHAKFNENKQYQYMYMYFNTNSVYMHVHVTLMTYVIFILTWITYLKCISKEIVSRHNVDEEILRYFLQLEMQHRNKPLVQFNVL